MRLLVFDLNAEEGVGSKAAPHYEVLRFLQVCKGAGLPFQRRAGLTPSPVMGISWAGMPLPGWDPVKVGAEPRSWDCVIQKLLCVGGNPVSARPACFNWITAQSRAVGLCSGATLWGTDAVQGARVSSD